MNRRASIVALAGAAAAPAAALGQAKPDPIKIGVTYPLTGPLAPSATISLTGAQLAVEEINKAGGVKGRPLQLVIEDTQGTPEGGVAAMRKLAQVDGIQAFITIYTNVVTAQMPLADALKVTTLSTVESPGLVSKSQFSFAHSPTITIQVPILRDFWKASGYKRLAAAFGNNALGQIIAPYVKAAAGEIGMEYSEVFFDLGVSDYRGLVSKIKEFAPDVLFVAAQGSVGETTMIRQLRELGVNAPLFLPTNNFQEANWRNAVGPLIEGLYLLGPNVDEATSPAFVHAFHAKTGQDPTYISAQIYDLIGIYAYAIGQAGYNGDAIRAAIANLKGVKSVMGGQIVMGPDHYSVNGSIKLWRVTDGKLAPAVPRKR